MGVYVCFLPNSIIRIFTNNVKTSMSILVYHYEHIFVYLHLWNTGGHVNIVLLHSIKAKTSYFLDDMEKDYFIDTTYIYLTASCCKSNDRSIFGMNRLLIL